MNDSKLMPEDNSEWLKVIASQLQEGCVASADACNRLREISARIAELEAEVAEKVIPATELVEGQQYLAWICDGEWQVVTYWPSNQDTPLWCGATGYDLVEVEIYRKLTPPAQKEGT